MCVCVREREREREREDEREKRRSFSDCIKFIKCYIDLYLFSGIFCRTHTHTRVCVCKRDREKEREKSNFFINFIKFIECDIFLSCFQVCFVTAHVQMAYGVEVVTESALVVMVDLVTCTPGGAIVNRAGLVRIVIKVINYC